MSALNDEQGKPDNSQTLAVLLEALEGDKESLDDLICSFLASYPEHLMRISAAVSDDNAQRLEKTAHHFKGSLGIFSHAEPLALTEQLMEMGERECLTQAPRTLELLDREMESLAASLKEFIGR